MDEILIEKDSRKEKTLTGVVRIRPDAERIIQLLCVREDMSASELVSKIICAAAPYIKFKESED